MPTFRAGAGIRPAHRTSNVVELSRAIVNGRHVDRFPVLADALEEAGFCDRAVLDELRSPSPLVEYCGEIVGRILKTFNPFSRWEYSGDTNLEYGGVFIDVTDWRRGYCSAVRVTDLDSGCGFVGAVMIEHITINGTDDAEIIRRAYASCGWNLGRERPESMPPAGWKSFLRYLIAEALMSYWHCDTDDTRTEILQLEPDGPMQFDGWRADKRLHNTDLRAYVESVHLRD